MIKERWFEGNSKNLDDVNFIRREVFIKEQKVREEEEFDGTDEKYNSKILVLYLEGEEEKAFGTGRLIEIDGNLFIGRVAILKEYRGLNYGKVLLEKLIEKAKSDFSQKEIFIHAQSYAKKFYEKVGFTSFGEEFLEAGIPHLHMKIKL